MTGRSARAVCAALVLSLGVAGRAGAQYWEEAPFRVGNVLPAPQNVATGNDGVVSWVTRDEAGTTLRRYIDGRHPLATVKIPELREAVSSAPLTRGGYVVAGLTDDGLAT